MACERIMTSACYNASTEGGKCCFCLELTIHFSPVLFILLNSIKYLPMQGDLTVFKKFPQFYVSRVIR